MKPVYVWDDVNDPYYEESLGELLENPKFESLDAVKASFTRYVGYNSLGWEPKLQIIKISFEKVEA